MKKEILTISLFMLIGRSGWATFTPSENPNGVQWVSASPESWSGSAQSRSDDAILHIAGTFDTSVDTTNSAGVVGFLGLLAPIMKLSPVTPTPTHTLVLTPTITPGGPTLTITPTIAPGGPTLTITPTITPGRPTLTPTICIAAMVDADYNLDGVNGIDSRDLLLLYVALKGGVGNPFDFDCSGETDLLDLIRFSQKWKVDVLKTHTVD